MRNLIIGENVLNFISKHSFLAVLILFVGVYNGWAFKEVNRITYFKKI